MLPMLLFFCLLFWCANGVEIDNLEESFDTIHDGNNEFPSEAVAKIYSTNIIYDLLYRLDLVSCIPESEYPPKNYQSTYNTWVYYSIRRGFKCLKWHKGLKEIPKNTTMFAITPEKSNGKYKNRILQQFNVACPEDHDGKIVAFDVNLQDRQKIGDKEICLDYITFKYPHGKSPKEYCGEDDDLDSIDSNEFENVLVTFRSGLFEVQTGFYICIACMPRLLSNQMGCLNTYEEIYAEEAEVYTTNDGREDENDYWRKYELLKKYHELEEGKYIPLGAKKKLLKFFKEYHTKALANSVDSYTNILNLAIITEKSCDSLHIAVARGVLDLFPTDQVVQAKYQFYEGK